MNGTEQHRASRALRTGLAMLAVPLALYVMMRMEGSSHSDAGLVASWPAFLLWPTGLALIAGDLLRRLIRWIDRRADGRVDDPEYRS